MTATVTGSGTATRAPARARRPASRQGLAFPRASTTPGKVRLIRIGLVIACLGWGALAAELPAYTGYVEDGEVYNSLGYPAGASFIQVASEEMHLKLLPAARAVYAQENSRLTAASAQATGLPLAVATLVAGLAVGFFLYRTQRWLSRRTHRTFNVGLLVASVLALIMAIGSARGLSRRLAEYR